MLNMNNRREGSHYMYHPRWMHSNASCGNETPSRARSA